MDKKNYSKNYEVEASAKQVFDAFSKKLGDWWGSSHEGVNQVGDKMMIGFEENPKQWQFEAMELIEGKRIVLKCRHSNHQHEGLPATIQQEWLDSQLIWEFKQQNDHTEINFTHIGLTPELECFSVCQKGWDHYLGDGLSDYLNAKS